MSFFRNEENDTQKPSYSTDCSKLKPANPADGCPRCGGAVYEAEKMLAKGAVREILIILHVLSYNNYDIFNIRVGTKLVSIALNAEDPWILFWHAMDLIGKFTASPVTERDLDLKGNFD